MTKLTMGISHSQSEAVYIWSYIKNGESPCSPQRNSDESRGTKDSQKAESEKLSDEPSPRMQEIPDQPSSPVSGLEAEECVLKEIDNFDSIIQRETLCRKYHVDPEDFSANGGDYCAGRRTVVSIQSSEYTFAAGVIH